MDMQQINPELFVRYDNNSIDSEKITAPRYSYWRSVFRCFFKNPMNTIVLVLLGLIFLMSFIYPLFVNYDQFDSIANPNFGFSETYNLSGAQAIKKFGFKLKWIFGTTMYGASLFDGVWSGAQTSLALALICAAINMTVGVIVGALWGYSRIADAILTEIYNIVSNVPFILFVSVFVLVVGPGFWSFVAAMTITGWLGIAYFIRTQVIIIRDREYNLASKCLGTPVIRMVTKNMLPFITSIIVTILSTEIPSYISSEVFLSYIGIGFSEKNSSLGSMIGVSQAFVSTPGREHLFWIPVMVASAITVILYIVGQNLADACDPRTHM